MNINELKIGDRVKYKVDYYPYIYEATIIYIDNKKANVESGLVYGSQTVDINNIISKLEPFPSEIKYKEIFIEKPLYYYRHNSKESADRYGFNKQ